MFNKSEEKPPRVETIVTFCPYCMQPQNNKTSCCGEVYFETDYIVDGEYYLESDLKLRNNTAN